MNSSRKYLLATVSLLLFFPLIACTEENPTPEENTNADKENIEISETGNDVPDEAELAYNPPSLEELEGKNDPLSGSIKYGYQVVNNTHEILPEYVGNQLSCTSCHGNAGLDMTSSFVGVVTQFPQYRPREDTVFTLEDRINGCMLRSMNGQTIPYDSEEMRAMVSYLTYISKGIEVGADIPWRMLNTMKDIPETDVANGEELYKQSCLACHGENGEGLGANVGPALWGDNSFNDGAGMARMTKMAGYIVRNMPIGQEGTLTKQEAADLAAYILSQERPKWEGRENDWPIGGAPKDVPYYNELKSVKEKND